MISSLIDIVALIIILVFLFYFAWFYFDTTSPVATPLAKNWVNEQVHNAFNMLVYQVRDKTKVGHPGIPLKYIAEAAGVSELQALSGMLELAKHIPTIHNCPGRPPLAHCLHGNWYPGSGEFIRTRNI